MSVLYDIIYRIQRNTDLNYSGTQYFFRYVEGEEVYQEIHLEKGVWKNEGKTKRVVFEDHHEKVSGVRRKWGIF